MYKQLINYVVGVEPDKMNPVVVETSPDLPAAQFEEWEKQVAAKYDKPPTGRQWGIIDANHPWFDPSLLPQIPIDMGKPGALLSPEQILMRERTEQMRNRFNVDAETE